MAVADQVQTLRQHGVSGVALTYVDNAGITRVKTIPTRGLGHAATVGVGMSPVFDVFCVDDSITASRDSGGPDGDLRLRPDLAQLVEFVALPGWAWAPVDRFQQDGTEHPGCSRAFLRRMVQRLADRGWTARAAIEIEWGVGKPPVHGDFVPACSGPAYGMTSIVQLSDYSRDLLSALDRQGITVAQLHPEYAPGQFELSIAAADPVTAADQNVLVRQTIRAIGQRHDIATSFAPIVAAGGVGNGAHLHLSLWAGDRNLFAGGPGPAGLTAEGERFLAGILDQMPALVGITAPSVASYLRMVPSHWAGIYRCWGVENREAAMRFIPGSAGPASANVELKCIDPSANPYLAIGATLALGLASGNEKLPAPISGDPVNLPATERLPESLPAALDRLNESAILREAMGDRLFEAFLAVRAAEFAAFGDLPVEKIIAATRWRY
jgi:glutamine synthetase